MDRQLTLFALAVVQQADAAGLKLQTLQPLCSRHVSIQGIKTVRGFNCQEHSVCVLTTFPARVKLTQ